MPATTPSPQILQEPGYLFWAPLGTAVPANTVTVGKFSDTWPTAWINLGATMEGSTFSVSTSVEPVRVAEFFDPVRYATTDRSGSIAFALASVTLSNLKRVVNGGVITVTGVAGAELNTFDPPEPGSEVRCMIGWESLDSTMRLILFQAFQGGSVDMSFRRAPDYTTLSATFNMEKPASNPPFRLYTAGTTRA